MRKFKSSCSFRVPIRTCSSFGAHSLIVIASKIGVSEPGRFCCRSRLLATGRLSRSVGSGLLCTDANVFTRALHHALSRIWRWSGDQRCEPPQVLGDGGENELILGASRAAQPKPPKPQDAL